MVQAKYEVTYSRIEQVIGAQATFCVQKGSANDVFFSTNPKWKDRLKLSLTEETKRSSAPDQIEGVLDGTCASSEITKEDFYAWAKEQPLDRKCGIKLNAVPLARRARGMLSIPENICAIEGINALFAFLTVNECNGITGAPPYLRLCDSEDLHAEYFPEVGCSDILAQAYTQEPLDPLDFLGTYVVLIGEEL